MFLFHKLWFLPFNNTVLYCVKYKSFILVLWIGKYQMGCFSKVPSVTICMYLVLLGNTKSFHFYCLFRCSFCSFNGWMCYIYICLIIDPEDLVIFLLMAKKEHKALNAFVIEKCKSCSFSLLIHVTKCKAGI